MASRKSIRPSILPGSVGMAVASASANEVDGSMKPATFKQNVSKVTDETLASLAKIWKEAGYEESECEMLLADLFVKMKTTYLAELAAEQQILEHAKVEVANKCEHYRELCTKLGRKPTASCGAGANYADKLAGLESLLSEIETEVSERQGLLDVEFDAINELVTMLGEQAPSMDLFDGPEGTPLLSDCRLELLREFKESLLQLKQERIEEMKNVAIDCIRSYSDLVVEDEGFYTLPDCDVYAEMDAALLKFGQSQCTTELQMGVHLHDLIALKDRSQALLDEKERRRSELSETGTEIARLWTLLRVPSADREAFQASIKMNLSMETLAKGRDELERLREIRASSLEQVVGSIRNDITALWEEIGIDNDEQRQTEFPIFSQSVEVLGDSTVEVHEEYFTALKVRVEELRPILQKITRREGVVLERIELEHLQMNPERLQARGPNARDERKREEAMAQRVRALDKVTKELLASAATWEEAKNAPLMYAGARFVDRVANQDEHYIEVRDALRNSRKKPNSDKNAPEKNTGKPPIAPKAKALPKATPKHDAHPPSAPEHHAATATAAAPATGTPGAAQVDIENQRAALRNASMGSIETDFTSATSVTALKHRPCHQVETTPAAQQE